MMMAKPFFVVVGPTCSDHCPLLHISFLSAFCIFSSPLYLIIHYPSTSSFLSAFLYLAMIINNNKKY